MPQETEAKAPKRPPTVKATDRIAPDVWLQTPQVTVVLLGRHKRLLSQMQTVLEAAPSAERDVTASVIFAALADVAAERLVEDGLIESIEDKPAIVQLREGRQALDNPPPTSEGEPEAKGDAKDQGKEPAKDGDGVTVQPPFVAAKLAAACAGCQTPFAVGAPILFDGQKGRYGKGCCEAARKLAAEKAPA